MLASWRSEMHNKAAFSSDKYSVWPSHPSTSGCDVFFGVTEDRASVSHLEQVRQCHEIPIKLHANVLTQCNITSSI